MYNYFLSKSQRIYKEEGRTVKEGEVCKKINNELKPTTHKWLKKGDSCQMNRVDEFLLLHSACDTNTIIKQTTDTGMNIVIPLKNRKEPRKHNEYFIRSDI